MVGGDLTPFIHRYVKDCASVYETHPVETIRYGPLAANTIDLFDPSPGSAKTASNLHVYVHGGYWQELSKHESVFAAPSFLRSGEAFAAVDYTLAPAATVIAIVEECRAALQALAAEGFDPAATTISGWSAGAQLALMALAGLPPEHRPGRVLLISGIFELEPLIGTSINDALGLDQEAAHHNSPSEAELDGFPPALLVWGENDTDEFKRQSRAMHDRLARSGVPVGEREVAERNHFDVIYELDPALVDQIPTEPSNA